MISLAGDRFVSVLMTLSDLERQTRRVTYFLRFSVNMLVRFQLNDRVWRGNTCDGGASIRGRAAQQCPEGFRRYIRCGDLRSPGVTERLSGHSDYMPTTMMMMKDVRLVSKMEGKTNFWRRLQAVRN